MKVIFVCHGSICRSPACLYIARWLSEDIEFEARAISYEEIGNDIYPPMQAALSRAGIPFGRHHAAYLSEEDVRSADLIFYMDESNRLRLLRAYPNYGNKMKPVFAFTKGIEEIEDPWYTDRYDKVVRQLRQCVEDILQHLKK